MNSECFLATHCINTVLNGYPPPPLPPIMYWILWIWQTVPIYWIALHQTLYCVHGLDSVTVRVIINSTFPLLLVSCMQCVVTNISRRSGVGNYEPAISLTRDPFWYYCPSTHSCIALSNCLWNYISSALAYSHKVFYCELFHLVWNRVGQICF